MPGNGAGQSLYRESLLIKTPVGELPPVPSAPPSHSLRSFGRPRYSRAVSLTLTALLNSARFRFASGFAGQPTGLTDNASLFEGGGREAAGRSSKKPPSSRRGAERQPSGLFAEGESEAEASRVKERCER